MRRRCLAALLILLVHPGGFEHARWMALTTLVVAQAVRAYANRSLRQPVISLRPNPATHSNRVHTVLALGAAPEGAQSFDNGEEIAVELIPVPEVLRLLREGEVQQSTHVASLLLALAAAGRVTF